MRTGIGVIFVADYGYSRISNRAELDRCISLHRRKMRQIALRNLLVLFSLIAIIGGGIWLYKQEHTPPAPPDAPPAALSAEHTPPAPPTAPEPAPPTAPEPAAVLPAAPEPAAPEAATDDDQSTQSYTTTMVHQGVFDIHPDAYSIYISASNSSRRD